MPTASILRLSGDLESPMTARAVGCPDVGDMLQSGRSRDLTWCRRAIGILLFVAGMWVLLTALAAPAGAHSADSAAQEAEAGPDGWSPPPSDEPAPVVDEGPAEDAPADEAPVAEPDSGSGSGDLEVSEPPADAIPEAPAAPAPPDTTEPAPGAATPQDGAPAPQGTPPATGGGADAGVEPTPSGTPDTAGAVPPATTTPETTPAATEGATPETVVPTSEETTSDAVVPTTEDTTSDTVVPTTVEESSTVTPPTIPPVEQDPPAVAHSAPCFPSGAGPRVGPDQTEPAGFPSVGFQRHVGSAVLAAVAPERAVPAMGDGGGAPLAPAQPAPPMQPAAPPPPASAPPGPASATSSGTSVTGGGHDGGFDAQVAVLEAGFVASLASASVRVAWNAAAHPAGGADDPGNRPD